MVRDKEENKKGEELDIGADRKKDAYDAFCTSTCKCTKII